MKKILFLFTIASLIQAGPTLAASLYFTPTAGTFAKGSTLKVNITVNTAGENINAVQANFSYPTDKLQFTSISTGGSAMTIVAERSGGGGFVKLAGGTPNPGFSGTKFLGAAYFKVLSDSGTADLNFMGDSAVLRNSDNQNVLSSRGAAKFNFAGYLPSPTPNAPMQISEVSASPTQNDVSISWTTDQKSTSIVEYGLDTRYGLATSSAQLTTNHQLSLTLFLLPGITYHYQVKSADGTGVEVTSPDLTFSIPGSTTTPSPSPSTPLPARPRLSSTWIIVSIGLVATVAIGTSIFLWAKFKKSRPPIL